VKFLKKEGSQISRPGRERKKGQEDRRRPQSGFIRSPAGRNRAGGSWRAKVRLNRSLAGLAGLKGRSSRISFGGE
jgi:hypothetical protein